VNRALRGAGLVAALILGGTCSLPETPSPRVASPGPSGTALTAVPASQTPSSQTPTSSPSSIGHRIGVRVVDGAGEFFDQQTGQKFVPRGFDWVRLSGGGHASFDEGVYDPAGTDAEFTRIAAQGYNTIRVFLNTYEGGVLGVTTPLSSTYLDRVADFLDRAAGHGLYVVLTQDELAGATHYGFASDPGIESINAVYLSKGGVSTDARYFGDLARELVGRGARLDALLAYELRNELYFTDKYPPFSLASGSVTTANGETYDMASQDDRWRMLEDNVLHWIEVSRSAILAVDPTALVTVGFFQPQGPVPSRIGDDRLIETRRAISESSADFIDLHGYPGGELNLDDLVTNFKLPAETAKPILMGEFGASHFAYPSIDDAVMALVNWQIESCTYGFDGWLLWPWDSADQPEFWSGVDENARLAEVLAPTTRPDPCTLGPLDLATDLTHGATAEASSTAPGFPPSNAIDGLADTYWNAATVAPQWIRIDLGSARTVEEIRLNVAQDPPGQSRHVVSVRSAGGDWHEVHVFKGITENGQLLIFRPDSPLMNVRYVRIETTALAADLWPAWREIRVLGR
jgi:F5/8 type C domain/Cellulase (glycosyl hydrolase family 5)